MDLAHHFGLFFRPHRAVEDCVAPRCPCCRPRRRAILRPSPLADVVAAVKHEAMQVDAIAVPCGFRDRLKRRGYRWVPESDASPAARRIEVMPEHLEAELTWLDRHIPVAGDVSSLTSLVTAVDRYHCG